MIASEHQERTHRIGVAFADGDNRGRVAQDRKYSILARLQLGQGGFGSGRKSLEIETRRKDALLAAQHHGRLVLRTLGQSGNKAIELFLVQRIHLAIVHHDDVCAVFLCVGNHVTLRSNSFGVFLDRNEGQEKYARAPLHQKV